MTLEVADARLSQDAPPVAAATADPVKNDPAGVVADAVGAAEEDKTPPSPVATGEPAETVVDLVVPDIGDFADIPVIEVLVAPGDTIAKDAPLVSLESDKRRWRRRPRRAASCATSR